MRIDRTRHRLTEIRFIVICMLDCDVMTRISVASSTVWTKWFVLITWLATMTSSLSHHPEVREFCQWETFNASCHDPDDVILMLTARYGRMRFGRCMREDHGSVGCSADVISHMDRKCSGRRTCHLTIPDATLHSIHQCPKEIMPYLEASYTCISVKSSSRNSCIAFGAQPLSSETGFLQPNTPPPYAIISDKRLAPSSTNTIIPGTTACPWRIQMRSGQRINLTLFNFHLEISDLRHPIPPQSMGTIREEGLGVLGCGGQRLMIVDMNRTTEMSLCGEKQRERHLYTSEGNSISVYLVMSERVTKGATMLMTSATQSSPPSVPFLIRYQVLGCPDITELYNAWVRRRGDTAVVKCNFTGETFFLTCVHSRWKGELTRCTSALPTKSSQMVDTARQANHNHGILIVIGIGVALGVALGVFILFALILFHRRRKGSQRRSGERLYPDTSLTELDERKNIVYFPGRTQHGASVAASVRSSKDSATTGPAAAAAAAPCPCQHQPYTAECRCGESPLVRQLRLRPNPLQPSAHCRAVEAALLINCGGTNSSPTHADHSGLTYQQYQMNPIDGSSRRETPEVVGGGGVTGGCRAIPPEGGPSSQHDQQTVLLTFRPPGAVTTDLRDGGTPRTELDLIRHAGSLPKDQPSLTSSSDDSLLNDNNTIVAC